MAIEQARTADGPASEGALPRRFSNRARAITVGVAVVAISLCAWMKYSLSSRGQVSRGRPYNSPALAFQGDSNDLRQLPAGLSASLDTPMPKGRNVVWCGALQLAWNHLGKDVLHGPPSVRNATEVYARLNRAKLDETDLPSDGFLGTAGFVKDGVVEKVKTGMKLRFRRDVQIDPMEPNDIFAYAYLEANAAFTVPYFDKQGGLPFRDSSGAQTNVSAFGIEERHEYAYEALREQIDILYLARKRPYSEELDEFVVDLGRDSTPNQIIIACVPPGPDAACERDARRSQKEDGGISNQAA